MENELLVSLTFDDGWKSQYENAVPVLEKYGIKATFYVLTQFVHHRNLLNFNTADILSLKARGHEIGAHTVTHPDLYFTFLWKGKEIGRSKKDLEKAGINAESFAYPYGHHHWFIRRIVKKSGYHNARVVGNRLNIKGGSRWCIAGKYVTNTTELGEVEKWIHTAREEKAYLVIIFHQVEEHPLRYGCTPQFLDDVCKLLRRSEPLRIATLTDGWKLFTNI